MRTQCLVDGEPAHYKDPLVVVGASELYEARCREHHEVPGRPGALFQQEARQGQIERVEIVSVIERLAKIERVNAALSYARQTAEVLVDEFIESGDFKDLVLRAREEHETILSQFGMDSSSISTFVTDGVKRRWNDGNRFIVEEAGKLGVEPHPNNTGKRLQARDCLNQILTKEVEV